MRISQKMGVKYRLKTMNAQMRKSNILLSTQLIGLIHSFYRGVSTRVDWYLFINHTRRIDYALMYLENNLNFLILSFCLLFPKGISKDVKIFIFICYSIDLLHYFAFSSIYFAFAKLFVSTFLFYVYKKLLKIWLN